MSNHFTLERLLYSARHYQASDIHLIAGLPPAWRVNGEIMLAEAEPFTAAEVAEFALEGLTAEQKAVLDREMALCYSFAHEELGRFRVSIYLRNGSPELAIRACTSVLRTRKELGLPSELDELTTRPSGLILITGATGSGKTTTLNYMIDQINSSRRCKIIMIEDPIEYVHDHKMALVVQQELYTDVPNFNAGLLHILRQDPDVIGIGEMRNHDTIATALTAAETGHLLLSSLHTVGAAKTIDRIIDTFPANQQQQVRVQLSMVLRAVVSQRLVPTVDGTQVPVFEVMTINPAIQNMIRDGKTFQIDNVIYGGAASQAMLSMDNELIRLTKEGRITKEAAQLYAVNPDMLRKRLI